MLNLCILGLLNASITPSLKLQIINTYNNNILNLSDDHLDEFEDNIAPDKYKIATSDDFISGVKVDVGLKYYIAGHTQIIRFLTKYNHYWTNDFMDDGYIGINIRQYLSKKFNVGLYAFYYPEIYVHRYNSMIDNKLHDYTYEKNIFRGDVVYKANRMFKFKYELEIGQLIYNKYFTEYDADQLEHSVTVYLHPYELINMRFSYSYNDSKAAVDDGFSHPEIFSVIKDGSYESNNYKGVIEMPEFLVVNDKKFSLDFILNFNEKFYQSEKYNDAYHFDREDYILSFETDFGFDLTEDIGCSIFYSSQQRTTDSCYSYVEDDKGYKTKEVGINLMWKYFNKK